MATQKTGTRQENVELVTRLMKDIDITMFTTVGQGGYLVSRPLSTQDVTFDGERVWFFTEADSPKVTEIARNKKVNLAYASKGKNTYISVTGDARISRDQRRIDQFWNDALKAFFPKGKNDPNLALIEVALRTAEYWDGPGSFLGKAISFVVARVTGNDDVMAKTRIVDLKTGRSRKPPSSDTSPRKGKAAVKNASKPLSVRHTAKKSSTATKKFSAAPKVLKATAMKKTPSRAVRRTAKKSHS